MIYFRSIPKPGSWDAAEWIGRDNQGDLVRIIPGVTGRIWDKFSREVSGFAIEDMHGNRLAWHYHHGAAEELAANIARQLRRGDSVDAIKNSNPTRGNDQ